MLADPSVLEIGPLLVAPRVREVTLAARPLPLTRLEVDLLIALAEPSPRAIRRDDLLDGVWGRSSGVGPHALEAAISSIRAKLGEHRDMVRTVRGVGYSLVPPGAPLPARKVRASRERAR